MNNIYRDKSDEFVLDVSMAQLQGQERVISTFDFFAPGYEENLSDYFKPQELLECMSLARAGKEMSIRGAQNSILKINRSRLSFDSHDRRIGGVAPIEREFDHFLLDTFTVIENGERKRIDREIFIGDVERCILDIISKNPKLLSHFDPRLFEVAVSYLLKEMGFIRVELKRFSQDNGIDIYAVYAEGDTVKTVIVEVKRQDKNVGIAIVDRLYGVRSREVADKALLVTSSGITKFVKKGYSAKTDTMAFLTYEHICDLVQRDEDHWMKTPSDLWTTRST